jgi:ferredoxin
MKVYLDTCVHCGLCAEACHTYISRDKDPDFAPVAKVKNTLWEMVKRKGKVDGALPATTRPGSPSPSAARAVAAACTAPSASTSAYQIMTVRRILQPAGDGAPVPAGHDQQPRGGVNQMWVQPDDWIDTLMWQEEDGDGRARRGPHSPRQGGGRHHVLGDRARAQDSRPADRQHGHHLQGGRRLDHAERRRLGQQQHGHVLGRLRGHGPGRAPALGAGGRSCGSSGWSWASAATPTAARSTTGPSGWLEAAAHPDGARGGVLLRPHQERPSSRSSPQDRGAGDGAGPVQHRARPRPARQAPLRGQRPLRGLPRHGPARRAQLLLRRRAAG